MALERLNTPPAECLWAQLQEPSHDETGEYEDNFEITLVLDTANKDHKEFLNLIGKLHREAGGTANPNEKGHPVKNHYVKEEVTNDLGEKIMQKVYVEGKTCFDSGGQVIFGKKGNFIANGSLVIVGFSHRPYDVKGNKGVSMYLNYVVVRQLIEWTGEIDFDKTGVPKTDEYRVGDIVDTASPVDDNDIADEDVGKQDGSPVEDDLLF